MLLGFCAGAALYLLLYVFGYYLFSFFETGIFSKGLLGPKKTRQQFIKKNLVWPKTIEGSNFSNKKTYLTKKNGRQQFLEKNADLAKKNN